MPALDPTRSIVAYAMAQHAAYRIRYGADLADPALGHLSWHRLTTPGEVAAFLRST